MPDDEQFSISESNAIKWMQQFRRDGRSASSTVRGHRRAVLDPHRTFLLKLIKQQGDITLEEIRTILRDLGVEVCVTTIWSFYDRCGISFKKSQYAAEQDRPDVVAARIAWKEQQKQLDPDRLIFIDETGTSTNMARLRGRCARRERLIGKVPHGHWKITTFVAALRRTAPFVIDEPMNGEIFAVYLERCLVPVLRPATSS